MKGKWSNTRFWSFDPKIQLGHCFSVCLKHGSLGLLSNPSHTFTARVNAFACLANDLTSPYLHNLIFALSSSRLAPNPCPLTHAPTLVFASCASIWTINLMLLTRMPGDGFLLGWVNSTPMLGFWTNPTDFWVSSSNVLWFFDRLSMLGSGSTFNRKSIHTCSYFHYDTFKGEAIKNLLVYFLVLPLTSTASTYWWNLPLLSSCCAINIFISNLGTS